MKDPLQPPLHRAGPSGDLSLVADVQFPHPLSDDLLIGIAACLRALIKEFRENPVLQHQLHQLQLVGLGEDDVKAKFPAMYNAFCYGAPPHAGIAPGVDRMVMLLAGEESIREIIPFPMNKTAQDVMMGAPATVDPKQLADVHIAIVKDEKEEKED